MRMWKEKPKNIKVDGILGNLVEVVIMQQKSMIG